MPNQGECSPCCAEMPVCKQCGIEGHFGGPGSGSSNCDSGHCARCCAQLECCKPKDGSPPATPPRMCGCNPRCTEVSECEGCGWNKPCRYVVEKHEAACSRYHQKFKMQAVPETAAGHCRCSGHWLDSVREKCYDRQCGRNVCECPGGGVPHVRNQLNKCQQCDNWLDEVWRGKEPTRSLPGRLCGLWSRT